MLLNRREISTADVSGCDAAREGFSFAVSDQRFIILAFTPGEAVIHQR